MGGKSKRQRNNKRPVKADSKSVQTTLNSQLGDIVELNMKIAGVEYDIHAFMDDMQDMSKRMTRELTSARQMVQEKAESLKVDLSMNESGLMNAYNNEIIKVINESEEERRKLLDLELSIMEKRAQYEQIFMHYEAEVFYALDNLEKMKSPSNPNRQDERTKLLNQIAILEKMCLSFQKDIEKHEQRNTFNLDDFLNSLGKAFKVH